MRLLPRNFKLTLKNFCWCSLIAIQIISYGSYTILVHLSEENGRIIFNSTSLNFIIEFLKLTISLACYLMVDFFRHSSPDSQNLQSYTAKSCDEESQNYNSNSIKPSLIKSLHFSIPAMLYCINNNLGKQLKHLANLQHC